jgi:hypothetical protein
MTHPPSIPRALALIERVADDMASNAAGADPHAATRAANRVKATLRADRGMPADVRAMANDLCNGIVGAVEYATSDSDRTEAAAGDLRHRVAELRELLGRPADG